MWSPYVPVAARRARALREMNKLRKKGKDIQPVEIEGRTIARSVWGKRWCDHLESYSDYANRLPRGRTYVRNGSVCHLEVHPGRIDAVVSGSELYTVSVGIKKLKAAVWKSIKTRCSGQIGSMLELLQGKLSGQVMGVVSDREHGLFPKPREIDFDCSCPDWATMCKHVASVLYGVGSRLDQRPESLFLLRGVDAQELIAAEIALPESAEAGDGILEDDALAGIFDIDLDTEAEAAPPPLPKAPARSRKGTHRPAASATGRQTTPVSKAGRASAPGTPTGRRARKATSGATRVRTNAAAAAPRNRSTAKSSATSTSNIRPTGKSVARLRKRHGLSVAQFASRLGVSPVTVYRWEETPGRLNLQARSLSALTRLHRSTAKPEKR